MCLVNLFNLADFLKDLKETIGYKVFHEYEGKYIGTHSYGTQLFKLNEWTYDNSDEYIYASSIRNEMKYKSGYHIFVHLEDAIKYFNMLKHNGRKQLVLAEVEYNDIVCVGSQYFLYEGNTQKGLCVVAKEMKIVEILEEGKVT